MKYYDYEIDYNPIAQQDQTDFFEDSEHGLWCKREDVENLIGGYKIVLQSFMDNTNGRGTFLPQINKTLGEIYDELD